MFRKHLIDGVSALTYPAGNFKALGRSYLRLVGDSSLYRDLSVRAIMTWESLQVPVEWGTLIERWLRGLPEDADWIRSFTLASAGD
jgi:hypothetical protein